MYESIRSNDPQSNQKNICTSDTLWALALWHLVLKLIMMLHHKRMIMMDFVKHSPQHKGSPLQATVSEFDPEQEPIHVPSPHWRVLCCMPCPQVALQLPLSCQLLQTVCINKITASSQRGKNRVECLQSYSVLIEITVF